MPPLRDPGIRQQILDALCASERGDGVLWDPVAAANLRTLLPKLAIRRANQILREHVQSRKEIFQVRETRDEWKDKWEFHYDFVIKIGGRHRYFECRLIEDAPDRPELFVANFHDAL